MQHGPLALPGRSPVSICQVAFFLSVPPESSRIHLCKKPFPNLMTWGSRSPVTECFSSFIFLCVRPVSNSLSPPLGCNLSRAGTVCFLAHYIPSSKNSRRYIPIAQHVFCWLNEWMNVSVRKRSEIKANLGLARYLFYRCYRLEIKACSTSGL